MTWQDYSYDEKVSILHSIACVAMADDRIIYSENNHIRVTAMRMDLYSYQKLIKDSQNESVETMISRLKSMSNEKKDDLGYLWMDCARHSKGGSTIGVISPSDFPKEHEVIKILAQRCNVNIKDSYTFYN